MNKFNLAYSKTPTHPVRYQPCPKGWVTEAVSAQKHTPLELSHVQNHADNTHLVETDIIELLSYKDYRPRDTVPRTIMPL